MSWQDKNVLITGISGFAGSYLAEELLRKGANVYGLIRKRADGSKPKNLVDRGIVDKVRLIEGDLTDITSLANALDESEPNVIFHLAAQSFVPRSFTHPIETFEINTIGTANLLEAVRLKDYDPVIVFAGSSEEYGLVISSEKQYERVKQKYGVIFPEPTEIPELPIKETNPLRPMSPYAVSKVHGEYIMRNYYHAYGMKTIVSRGFNHEGAGRGLMFVTSVVTNQVMKLKFEETDKIVIGNVNAFRDWSHVMDIVNGYILLAEKGKSGEIYNQGSMRTNSVMSYILLSLEQAGWEIKKIKTMKNNKVVENPTEIDTSKMFDVRFEKTKIDKMLLEDEIEFTLEDKGVWVYTDKGKIPVVFDPRRFRPAEVPILLSDTTKIQRLGFEIRYKLKDIIRDQLNYFLNPFNRKLL
ncbi:GDP-mannose 4,6-dehydratase [Thermococcus barophilus]|uniref:GDP-mannose 4,6-dehydratase n=1 Tax=Thermococcus barophilus TaxID=55802 RepID=A0A0S1XF37_THEBA|nr:GDP-mannose 4,6-dehydratase [Thermococcus barophilus]ALM76388.1 GDP-mannose 4,6-dehydratase [Thermococcus barophilus]